MFIRSKRRTEVVDTQMIRFLGSQDVKAELIHLRDTENAEVKKIKTKHIHPPLM